MAENYDRQTLHRRSSPEAASRFLGVPGLGSVEGTDLRVLTEWEEYHNPTYHGLALREIDMPARFVLKPPIWRLCDESKKGNCLHRNERGRLHCQTRW